jgi:hypothetical protein
VEQNSEDEWSHVTVAERALTGTWVIDKVTLTVQKCYTVVEIFEIYEYEVT